MLESVKSRLWHSNGSASNGSGSGVYVLTGAVEDPRVIEEINNARMFFGIRPVAELFPGANGVPVGLVQPIGGGPRNAIVSHSTKKVQRAPMRLDFVFGMTKRAAIRVRRYRQEAVYFVSNKNEILARANPAHKEHFENIEIWAFGEGGVADTDFTEGVDVIYWADADDLMRAFAGKRKYLGGQMWMYPELGENLHSVFRGLPLSFATLPYDQCPIRYAAPVDVDFTDQYMDIGRPFNLGRAFFKGIFPDNYPEYIDRLLLEGDFLLIGENHEMLNPAKDKKRILKGHVLLQVEFSLDQKEKLRGIARKLNNFGKWEMITGAENIRISNQLFTPGSSLDLAQDFFQSFHSHKPMFTAMRRTVAKTGSKRGDIFVGKVNVDEFGEGGTRLLLDLKMAPGKLFTSRSKWGKTSIVSVIAPQITRDIFWFPCSKVDERDSPIHWIKDFGGSIELLDLWAPDQILKGVTLKNHLLDNEELRERLIYAKHLDPNHDDTDEIVDETILTMLQAWDEGYQDKVGLKACKFVLLEELIMADQAYGIALAEHHFNDWRRRGYLAGMPKYFDPGTSFLTRVYTVYKAYADHMYENWYKLGLGKHAEFVFDNAEHLLDIGDKDPSFNDLPQTVGQDLFVQIMTIVSHGRNKRCGVIVIMPSEVLLEDKRPGSYEAFAFHFEMYVRDDLHWMNIIEPTVNKNWARMKGKKRDLDDPDEEMEDEGEVFAKAVYVEQPYEIQLVAQRRE